MKTTFSIATFLTALTLATAAFAQTSASPGYGYAVHPGNTFYPGTYGYGHHASTLEAGILQGFAALAAGTGEGNYYNSLARINNQEAYARFIKNREAATQTYFRIRQINLAGRDAERSERLSSEQYAVLAKMDGPGRLSHQQYDTTLGRLSWPAALAGEDFAADREALDRAFRGRSPGDVGTDTEFYGEVKQVAAAMQETLRNHINDLDAAQYMSAKKFLMSLSYEARQSMVARTLASR
jgi:hypothetical protein